MNIIRFENVSLTYGEKEIMKNFSLQVDEGEKILITGKSGKGKSTLLRLLLGFSKQDTGNIYCREKSIEHLDFYETRQMFAYVNQDVTLRQGKVTEVLGEIAKFSGNHFGGELNKDLCEWLEFENELLQKDTTQLSGGERQRLGIIIAIMLQRPVFLLDEVTSALDEGLKRKVVRFFEESNKTVIAISHDAEWSKNGIFRKVEW